MGKEPLEKRLKLAIKCILGKNIKPSVTKHEYKLYLSDQGKFEGTTALVTGGTGAIGSAICYQLAALGATVGVCGRSMEKINSTIEFVKRESPAVAEKMIPVVLDVNNDVQIEDAIQEFISGQGKIDVMINNAGGQPGRVGDFAKHLYEQTIEQIDLVLDTNLRGTIMCSRVVARYMAEQKQGHIINMASVIGMGGKAGYCDYSATKAAIIGFTKSLALEMAEFGVRVNCISPGLVNQTPFDSGSEIRATELTALKRAGYTEEIAVAVTFLMQDEYITGHNLVVDGGRSIGLFGDD